MVRTSETQRGDSCVKTRDVIGGGKEKREGAWKGDGLTFLIVTPLRCIMEQDLTYLIFWKVNARSTFQTIMGPKVKPDQTVCILNMLKNHSNGKYRMSTMILFHFDCMQKKRQIWKKNQRQTPNEMKVLTASNDVTYSLTTRNKSIMVIRCKNAF